MDPYGREYFEGRRMLAREKHAEKLRRKILRVAEVTPASRVLEIGCGYGALSRLLAPEVARLEALDISAHAIETARKGPSPANVTWTVSDALADEPRGPFDLVLAMAVFEHFDADGHATFLGNVARWLAPGGRVAILVPITRSWAASRRQRKRGVEGVDYTGDPTHLATFSLASFRKAVTGAGFRIEKEWVRYARWGFREGVSRAILRAAPAKLREKFAMEAIVAASPGPTTT